uniref:Uncharacterized protein n=1 Tax=Chelydra serpentina TaxID=8475 RepID=A0A8C3RW93_CHESE
MLPGRVLGCGQCKLVFTVSRGRVKATRVCRNCSEPQPLMTLVRKGSVCAGPAGCCGLGEAATTAVKTKGSPTFLPVCVVFQSCNSPSRSLTI